MSTIKEIAKLAGVGVGTVSRVLNGGQNVSQETLEKVLEISRKLNYKPNKTARSLVKGHYSQPTIGVVFTVAIHPFFQEILKGIYHGLKPSHYNLLIFNTGGDRSDVFNRIPYENLAGVLIVSTKMTPEEKRQLKMNGVPFLYLDYFEQGENSIYLDNFRGGGLAAEYLLSQQAAKIAFVGENTRNQQFEERYAGFLGKLEENGLGIVCRKLIDIKVDMPFDVYEQESYLLTKELLQEKEIDGIFYYCDEFAYGGLTALRELGRQLPIIGYDDILPSKYLELTTVRQPAYQLGLAGAETIMELAADQSGEVLNQCIRPELMIRST
ncbi:LacI family transcriptional regulator [Hydrogenispora ethanolica]|jgi:DNA-binding LacI/PurR family transcriptional regulator|uniref:LacI family transcriptional regulator n=1 Tax=Hydrogenispora ethanolica TaxID=1082276 RepID=A0A4R1R0J3_HYDET|nr:LacI family DNA-binding transcriptional regulator [Hydrogenispora ethanolica]TCL58801.1 LacI family transcriptional regulator [Hydrogenispora ethanolica]